MSNNNLATELSLLGLSLALIAAMVVLLLFGKITWIEAVPFLTVVGGLYGVNGALKAPSPTQQETLNRQQDNLQNLINLLATHTHPAPPMPPSPPTQPVQPVPVATSSIDPGFFVPAAPPTPQFVPDPATSLAAYQTGMMPTVKP
jgi:hypothetical protein